MYHISKEPQGLTPNVLQQRTVFVDQGIKRSLVTAVDTLDPLPAKQDHVNHVIGYTNRQCQLHLDEEVILDLEGVHTVLQQYTATVSNLNSFKEFIVL
ncbi:hypothetical protein BDA99DRAFT_561129 [Phascolomyces articulosus]|uniref:Uncharacterized protein n=1 Tax=Phascolomyces articulosus TaxID=60185 RepID=A0AAD5JXC7_9FUNG|nr:hypothetical protein BDA99DRAFT_561129 [Phascolomyces articulosus]